MPRCAGKLAASLLSSRYSLTRPDLHLPGAQPDGVAGQRDLQPQPLAIGFAQRRDGQLPGIVVWVQRLLRAVAVDRLPEVALLVEQSDADHRDAQIAGGLQLVTGDITQTTRVDRQRFAEHELHAEVRHALQCRSRVCLLEPRARLRRLLAGVQQILDVLAKRGIFQRLPHNVARHRLQHDPGIARQLPKHRIEPAPQVIGGMVPGRPHVQRKGCQGIVTWGDFGRRTRPWLVGLVCSHWFTPSHQARDAEATGGLPRAPVGEHGHTVQFARVSVAMVSSGIGVARSSSGHCWRHRTIQRTCKGAQQLDFERRGLSVMPDDGGASLHQT